LYYVHLIRRERNRCERNHKEENAEGRLPGHSNEENSSTQAQRRFMMSALTPFTVSPSFLALASGKAIAEHVSACDKILRS
jgi:hypothetical protein